MLSTFDQELLIDILGKILWSIELIRKRFITIRTFEDFLSNDDGLEKLDSICMQIINIGEALKEIDKITDSLLLGQYKEIDWKRAKGLRDIITHHYFDIDAEIVFSVCSERLPEMEVAVRHILMDLEEGR